MEVFYMETKIKLEPINKYDRIGTCLNIGLERGSTLSFLDSEKAFYFMKSVFGMSEDKIKEYWGV